MEIYFLEDLRSYIRFGAFIDPEQANDFLNNGSLVGIPSVSFDKHLSAQTKRRGGVRRQYREEMLYLNKWELHGPLGKNIYAFFHGHGNGSYGCWTDEVEMEGAKEELFSLLQKIKQNILRYMDDKIEQGKSKYIDGYIIRNVIKHQIDGIEQLREWLKKYKVCPGEIDRQTGQSLYPCRQGWHTDIEHILVNFFVVGQTTFEADVFTLQDPSKMDEQSLTENINKNKNRIRIRIR